MPSSITHELIAQEAVAALPKGTQEIVFSAPDYYLLGAQGPDVFFFYAPLADRSRNLGKRLHRGDVAPWFRSLLRALPGCAGEEFKKRMAYAFGFCSHLSADTVFHPFVYRYLRESGRPKLTHQEIENDWDVYFLKKIRGISPAQYRCPYDLKEISADGILFRYLSETAAPLGIELKSGPFRRMCKTYALYLAHIRRGRALKYVGLSELYPRKEPDPAYLGGKRFLALSEGNGRSADELFRRAADESALRISVFLEAFNSDMVLPDPLFSLHMLTGKPL